MPLWEQFVKEWPALQSVWMSVVGLVLLALVIGWGVGRFMYGQRIDWLKDQIGSLTERIKLRDDQMGSLQQRVAVAQPDELQELVTDLRERLAAIEPYGLPKQRAAAMLEVLKAGPVGGIAISLEIAAWDALNLFEQLNGIFVEARWPVTAYRGVFGLDDPPDCGVLLIRHRDTNEEVLAVVRRALDAAQLDYEERDFSNQAALTPAVPQISLSSRDRNYQPKARWA